MSSTPNGSHARDSQDGPTAWISTPELLRRRGWSRYMAKRLLGPWDVPPQGARPGKYRMARVLEAETAECFLETRAEGGVAEDLLNIEQIMKRPHWTRWLVLKLLGKADQRVRYRGALMALYRIERVLEAERGDYFAELLTISSGEYLKREEIMARPGWTKRAINKHLGEPDKRTSTDLSLSLYLKTRVETAEQLPHFRDHQRLAAADVEYLSRGQVSVRPGWSWKLVLKLLPEPDWWTDTLQPTALYSLARVEEAERSSVFREVQVENTRHVELFLNQGELLRRPGWTRHAIHVLLGEPSRKTQTGKPMHLYSLASIEAAEQEPEFQAVLQGGKRGGLPQISPSGEDPTPNLEQGTRIQTFRFDLRATKRQEEELRRYAGACRWVYNEALRREKEHAQAGHKHLIGFVDMCKQLTQWRQEKEWLRNVSRATLQQSLWQLYFVAYRGFFEGRTRYPRMKKKNARQFFRFTTTPALRLDQSNERIYLPKLGWTRYRASRAAPGLARCVNVYWYAGRWNIGVVTERDAPAETHPSESCVGIDLGITRFATSCDGNFIEPINAAKTHAEKLRVANLRMSRKKKGGKNWQKEKAKIQKLHARIKNVRHDFLHQKSTEISKNHAVVFVEDLKVQDMIQSARKGRIEGKYWLAKPESIRDQGWSLFRKLLAYKLAWRGGRLVQVPRAFTSQRCPSCGHVEAANRHQECFACKACGFNAHADHVGAINIRRAGLAQIACEVSDAAMSPATGTHRGSGRDAPRADGIPLGGEEAKVRTGYLADREDSSAGYGHPAKGKDSHSSVRSLSAAHSQI